MDYFKNLLIGLVTGIAAYLNPISGEIKSLIAVFALNFICGLLTALLINHESFSFKKAWRCIVEATIFFVLVSCIYFIGEHKGNPEGALQCVSFITYSVFYFYGVNILRNIKEILPNSSNGYKVVAFLHYVLSVEFIKNIRIYLWLPVSDLFSSVLARIQTLMLQRDIEQLSDPNFIPDSSNAVYITFLIIGIIGYFTIPTVANWIVQAGGGAGNYGKNVNQAASKTGSIVGGAAGATVGNVAGRLIK